MRSEADVRLWLLADLSERGRTCLLYPCISDINFLSNFECIIDFYAKILDGTFDLCMSQ